MPSLVRYPGTSHKGTQFGNLSAVCTGGCMQIRTYANPDYSSSQSCGSRTPQNRPGNPGLRNEIWSKFSESF